MKTQFKTKINNLILFVEAITEIVIFLLLLTMFLTMFN